MPHGLDKFALSPFAPGLRDASSAHLAFAAALDRGTPGFLRSLDSVRIAPAVSLVRASRAAAPDHAPESKPSTAPAARYIGVCRNCGCTPAHPCDLPNGDECCWLTPEADLCSGNPCARLLPRASAAHVR